MNNFNFLAGKNCQQSVGYFKTDLSLSLSTLDVFDKVGTIKNRDARSSTLSIDIIQA